MDETNSNDHPEGDHTPAPSGMPGADESGNEPATVGIPSQAPAFGDLLGIHHRFNDANEFVTCVQAWARAQGFTVSRTGKNFSEKNPHPVHGGRGAIMWRSTLYCTHKDQACSGRSTCTWHIKFSYDKANLNYSITSIGLGHNHSITGMHVIGHGVQLLTLEKQLEPDEIDRVVGLGRFNLPVSKVREIMDALYPERMFCPSLLSRLKDRGRVLHLGPEVDSMGRFFEMGYGMKATGGVFHVNLTSALQLKSVVMQQPGMTKYATSYSDFVLCDGTHNVSMYVLKLMPFTVVDCLGRNVLCGVALDESENTETVKLGLELCKLHEANATLMTDGGSAYPGVALDLGMIHILCTKHFEDVILKGSTGLSGLAKAEGNALVYATMSKVEFQTRFDRAKTMYGEYKEADKALCSIYRHKEKVCRAFTGNVFTCSSLVTQRGESMNSVIKENGLKKKELRRFNLLQLAEHLWGIFQRQEIKACDELVTLLTAKRRWSNYVDSIWRANILQAELLPHVVQVAGKWYVSASQFHNVADAAHRIILGEDGGHPTCQTNYNMED
ncbi:hypothetical protein AaE_014983 [Aphanomyces astaci]|uniref:ZSWIM1/3 RNaseH-like domain-containing protein n=1 Tax=Aphanomyces astaci TaxID=112090 RepID=A0A6A4YXS9_APHAT|nr:hypothetical protein AaE_014983 [Aphanomyces astaci]